MNHKAFADFTGAPEKDRLEVFRETANRLGAPVGNIEKDFWVCWTLDALYNRLPDGTPRMLFKGGTSLSKSYGLIERFSEDIDVTVFRDDLDQAATIAELEALSGNKRRDRLDAIRDACRDYISGPLRDQLADLFTDVTGGAGRIEVDEADPDGQTLLLWYPEVEERDAAYVQPAVRIESGAKSALDPNQPVTITPYVANELADIDLSVPNVTTIEASRTFWDKIVILHGLRHWFINRGELKGGGNRVSRHYYDLHELMNSEVGKSAVKDLALGADCVAHARMFLNRAPFDLASAKPPTFSLSPEDGMYDDLKRDYAAMSMMIFGEPPAFDAIVETVGDVERTINALK